MKLKVFLTMILLVVFAGHAHADFVKTDLTAGDQVLTWDTDTNLEWLDLSETKSLSYNGVLSSSYVVQDGFRFAKIDDFVELSSNFGITVGAEFNVEYYSPAQEFYSLLGSDYVNFSEGRPLIAMLDSSIGIEEYKARIGKISLMQSGNEAKGLILNSFNDRNDLTFASFLVRDYTPVPIPGAIWLFGSGIIGLTMVRRKQYKD